MEFVMGAIAGCGAVILSNPTDVVKTRMQLQGELLARGEYTVLYRNIFHAAYAVAKNDGLAGLQKGLVPALFYQATMNGVRLGLYRWVLNSGTITREDGTISPLGSVAVGAGAGVLGGLVSNPMFMIKIHMQSQAVNSIAVGHQHGHSGFVSALGEVWRKGGLKGLWRGTPNMFTYLGWGSAVQLFTHTKTKDLINIWGVFDRGSWQSSFCGAMLSGLVCAVLVNPTDVVATRVYNQGLDSAGRGLLYRGVFDCILKVGRTEGIRGFFKGITAFYFRMGPHTFFSLLFWDLLDNAYKNHTLKAE